MDHGHGGVGGPVQVAVAVRLVLPNHSPTRTGVHPGSQTALVRFTRFGSFEAAASAVGEF